MKFLADVNIEKPIVDEMRKMGYDITWVTEINYYLEDIEIFKLAKNENRILLTNDKDFGEIVFRQRLTPAGIILFRIKGQDVREKVKSLKKLLTFYKDKIARHFVVVTKEKIRFIPV
jgi:predicted nuclease of predicted toxin-antitoxin system